MRRKAMKRLVEEACIACFAYYYEKAEGFRPIKKYREEYWTAKRELLFRIKELEDKVKTIPK